MTPLMGWFEYYLFLALIYVKRVFKAVENKYTIVIIIFGKFIVKLTVSG